jgi:glycosyltransferase involved in cell wall biosynthesis
MRVLAFERRISDFGGAERILFDLMEFIESTGNQTELLALSIDFTKIPKRYLSRIRFTTLSIPEDIVEDFPTSVFKTLISTVLSLPRIFREVVKFKPNVIIASRSNAYIYFVTIIYRVPYILFLHDTPFYSSLNPTKYAHFYRSVYSSLTNYLPGHREFGKHRLRLSLKAKLLAEVVAITKYLEVRAAAKTIAPSKRVAYEAKCLWKVLPDVVSWGVDSVPIEPNESGIILSVGRLVKIKRIDLLLKAFARIYPNFPKARLLIAGRGPEASELASLVANLGLDGRVVFLGFVDEETRCKLLSDCEVFAFPSWDSYGLSALEALASGRKCVITVDAAIIEVASTDSNLYVCESNVSSFADGLSRALLSKTYPVSDRIRALTTRTHCASILKMLEDLASNRK